MQEQETPLANQPSWLVWPKDPQTALTPLMARFEEDPETEFVKMLGSPDKPHTLVVVVKMSDATKLRYEQEFQDEFLFEPNAPLELFGNSS